MLSEQHRELLSAYVDGEVRTRQRKTVLRLLRKSAEARNLVRQMQENSRRLRRLPRQPLSPEFEARLLQAFADSQATAAPLPPTAPPAPTLPLWLSVLAAAVVLTAVAVGSFLYFAGTGGGGRPAGSTRDRAPNAVPAPRPPGTAE
jgi:anti-sigma factor RsiW